VTKPDNSDSSDRDEEGRPEQAPPPKKERPVMPTAREAAAETGGRPVPAVVRWGYYLILVAVVVGLLGAVYLLFNKDTLVDNQMRIEGAERVTRDEADRVVSNALTTLIVINAIFGAFQALFAYKAREGQRRARMLVTIATVMVVLFHYLLVPTLFGQLGGLVAAIGAALLYMPSAREFFPRPTLR
jgi:Na+-driven multidrug efflux pump